MLRLAIALLLWCSCAPLTSPEGTGPGTWREQEPLIETPSALESYLEARSRLEAQAGPRPDFVLVVPFADESGFREGVWNVEYELANMLSIELEAMPSAATHGGIRPAAAVGMAIRLYASAQLRFCTMTRCALRPTCTRSSNPPSLRVSSPPGTWVAT